MPDLSRRSFTQFLGTAAVLSAVPIAGVASPRRRSLIRLSANENPYGPSRAAIAAMRDGFPLISRYPDDEADALTARLARLHGVSTDAVILGDGSGEILKLAAETFTGPARKLVMADPSFEAIGLYAAAAGAEVVRLPLTASHEHDLAKMLEISRGAGLVYICNPNNPTATITDSAAVRTFLDAVSADTFVLIDEAYHHYVTSRQYASAIEEVRNHPNVIVARTFSKIYGLAGLRCGYGIAQEAAARRMRGQQAWDTVNVMALVAARASLDDAGHVAEGVRRNSETRAWLRESLDKLGYRMLPSEANFVMIDLRRDVKPVISALRERNVRVGRLFPAMPQHLRVTIGTRSEMTDFVQAFRAVMS